MIAICITICIVVALICASACFIVREKTYAASDLSEQQLLQDINIRILAVYNRYLDEYNKAFSEGTSFYTNAKELFQAVEDVLEMTIDYKKQEKD